MNGWDAEAEAATMLGGLGIGPELHETKMADLDPGDKIKVLLAQALFGRPDVLLLDEPTNNLDIYAIQWLEGFLDNFQNTVIVVSHDRHFLNKVCSHTADIDFGKITVYSGNYDFWRHASELSQRLRSDANKKASDKAEELKAFIRRFSANASKSRQASSRQKQLEKIDLSELPTSTRKHPFVGFEARREAGKDIVTLNRVSHGDLLKDLSLTVSNGDKIVLVGRNDLAKTALLDILSGEVAPESGTVNWGITTSRSYFPSDNGRFFNGETTSLVDWLRQFSDDKDESFIRGFLGRMLFSRDEALKRPDVLSGGEKVRCMLSKMMLSGANVLLLDGPTNHLDLESISAVNEGIQKFNGTVIFTSHDHEFVQTVANRIVEIDGGIVRDERMSYDDFIASARPGGTTTGANAYG